MNTKQVQLLLEYISIEDNDKLYSPNGIDGSFGPKTQAAINHVKATYGCDETGLVGIIAKTVTKLKKPVEVKTASGDFWDDIQYFTEKEFVCPCGKCGGLPARPVEKLIRIADRVRAQAGRPAHVTSGVRCVAHNAELENSSPTSRHLKGWAMDFWIDGMTSTQLDALVGSQIGVAYHYKINDRCVHMDVIL